MKRDTELVIGIAVVAVLVYVVYTAEGPAAAAAASSAGGTPSSAGGSLAATILGAISGAENVATGHNNPGGICGSYDASGICLGPKTFDTPEAGESAGEALVNKYLTVNPSITLQQFVTKWTGIGNGAAFDNYISHLEDVLGIDRSEPISNAGSDDDGGDGGDGGVDDAGGDYGGGDDE